MVLTRLTAILLFGLLAFVVPGAWAAISSVGSFLNCNELNSDTDLNCTTTAQLDAGNVGVFVFSSDNDCTGTSGAPQNTNEHTSATISGNAMTKLREACNPDDGSSAGATVSVWTYRAGANIDSGATVVFNLGAAKTAKAAIGWEYSTGNTLESAATPQDTAGDGADVGAASFSGLTSKEYLFFRAIALERNGGSMTVTTDYTSIGLAGLFEEGQDNDPRDSGRKRRLVRKCDLVAVRMDDLCRQLSLAAQMRRSTSRRFGSGTLGGAAWRGSTTSRFVQPIEIANRRRKSASGIRSI